MSGTAAILASNRAAPTPAVASTFAKNRFDWETLLTTTAMPTGGSISRTGQAMYYDSTGLLTYAPNNLATYSEQFENATWTKAGVTATANAIVSPDGTTTANKLVETAATGTHYTRELFTVTTGVTVTASVYAKAGEDAYIGILCGYASKGKFFNLSNGTVGGNLVAAPTNATITSVGNGWYRCSVTVTTTGTSEDFEIYLSKDGSTYSYTGDGTSGAYVWGAQFELQTWQTTPSTYVATTASAYYGPRFDYDPATLQPKGLLIEGARTNLLTYSAGFGSGWTGVGTPSATTTNTAPDGTASAYSWAYNAGNTGYYQTSVTVAANTVYTISAYVKYVSGTAPLVRIGGLNSVWGGGTATNTAWVDFNPQTNAFSGVQTGVISYGYQDAGNGWKRVWLTASTNSSTTSTSFHVYVVAAGTLVVWGNQVEAASFPSSYIPTVASSVARASETFSITGYSTNLIEAVYTDEQTGLASSANYNAGTAPSPSYAWLTSLRAYTNAYAGDIAAPTWLDNSGTTGNRMYTDSTGTLTWSPSNMLLNSDTLSTQTVTVTSGATNILSFYGTGSITYSGAASGTRTGTGANNRVSVVLTMTTASLTLTVSGTVTQAQLERVTYQTAPRAYIPATSAAAYQPRFDYDASTVPASPRGLLIEESRANLLTYSNSVGGTNWINTILNYTGNSIVAPDGTTTASLFVPTTASGSHYTRQAVTVSSGATVTVSIYAKAGAYRYIGLLEGFSAKGKFFDLTAGTTLGNFVGAPTSSSMTAVGNGWYRLTVTATVPSTSADIEIYWSSDGSTYNSIAGDGTSGFYLWGAQLEAGSFATSYIPTTTASVTRVADVVKLTGTALTTAGAAIGSAIVQTSSWQNSTAAARDLLASATTRRLLYSNSSNTVISSTDGTTRLDATIGGSGTFTGGAVRSAVAWNASGRSLVANNGTLTSDAVNLSTGATVTLGGYGTTTTFDGWVASVAFYSSKLPDATLKSKSTVGAAY